MNKFIIFCCFYNASDYIERCIGSILSQNYENYQVMFVDDNSTDGSFDLIDDNEKFIKIRNTENKGLLYNYMVHLPLYAKTNDIVIVLDGDDALYGKTVLSYLNDYYNDNDCLMTYGQSIWTNGNRGFARPYTQSEFNNLRKVQYLASHLRTFKFICFEELMKQDPDFDCFKDEKGKLFMMAGDVATMFPMMEIAGFEKVKYIDKILYLYNINNPISDHIKDQRLQWNINDQINKKKRFKQIF